MTDLTQALAELRLVTPPNSPWEAGDIGVGSSPVDYHIATILNAVLSGDLIPVQCCMCGKTGLSIREGDGGPECQLDDGRWTCSRECWDRATGDLIPRADAELALALMVEKARSLCKTQAGLSKTNDYDLAWCRCAGYLEYEILTLTPASALAELQALRAERDAYKAASEAAHTDITTYLRIVADMTQEAEAAAAELAPLRAQVERLTGALTIAANRLHRCSVDYDTGTREFIEVGGWADEARAALTEGAAP